MPIGNCFVVPYYSMLCLRIFKAILKIAIYNFLKQIFVSKEGVQI